jgi:hypothetical protein
MPDTVVRRRSRSYTGVGRVAFLAVNPRRDKNRSHPRSRHVSGHVSRKPLWISCILPYDLRRRPWIGETVTTYSDGSPSSVHTTDFAYNGNQIVLQFDATTTPGSPVSLTANDLSHRYLNGPAVDQVLADERVTVQNGTLATDEVLFPLADAQGTVRDVAKLSGTTTAVVDHVIYNSFGGVVSESDPSQGCLFKYTGCPTDPATDIEFHFQRPKIAGSVDWLKVDQSSYTSGVTNLDDYCGNDPINETDPRGLDKVYVEPVLKPQSWWEFLFSDRRYLESYGVAYWVTSAGDEIAIGTAPLMPSIGEGLPVYGNIITLYPQFGGGTMSLQDLNRAAKLAWEGNPKQSGESEQQYIARLISMVRNNVPATPYVRKLTDDEKKFIFCILRALVNPNHDSEMDTTILGLL